MKATAPTWKSFLVACLVGSGVGAAADRSDGRAAGRPCVTIKGSSVPRHADVRCAWRG
jgi:hypothetical protein